MKDRVFQSRALFIDAASLAGVSARTCAALQALSRSFRLVAVGSLRPGLLGLPLSTIDEETAIPRFAREQGIELYASWFIGEGKDFGFKSVLPAGTRTGSSLSAILAAENASRIIIDPGRLALVAQRLRRAGKRIVFTNGVFDLLHVGHLRLLERARGLGGVLLVAINSDDSTRRIKGPGRPVVPQFARAELLVGLSSVDWCFIFTQSDPRRALSIVRPDFLVKGSDYTLRAVVGGASVRHQGGKVVRIALVEGISTTTTIHGISSPPARGSRS